MRGRLDTLTASAYQAEWRFSRLFRLGMCVRRGIADGPETQLYALCEADGGMWKFGIAKTPRERLRNMQVSNPRRLVMYAHVPATVEMEKYLHHALRRHRVGGEWFRASTRTLAVAHLLAGARTETEEIRAWDEEAVGPALTLAIMAAPLEGLPSIG